MIITIIIVSAILWSYFKTEEKWDKITSPPEGWIKSGGWFIKIKGK